MNALYQNHYADKASIPIRGSQAELLFPGGHSPTILGGMSIGRRIREARERAGLTQDTLAKALKVTKGAVFQWEKDLSTPKSARLAELARFLDVEYEWLATGRGAEAREYVKDETGSYSALEESERRVLMAFRRLPAKKKKALLEIIEP